MCIVFPVSTDECPSYSGHPAFKWISYSSVIFTTKENFDQQRSNNYEHHNFCSSSRSLHRFGIVVGDDRTSEDSHQYRNNYHHFNSICHQKRKLLNETLCLNADVLILLKQFLCAKLVNVTGACRRSRGFLIDEPVVLTFDEELNEPVDKTLDSVLHPQFKPSATLGYNSSYKFST
jgi:hypothetical protein